jgi:16S rRNA (adenine1518-N6/adenine1519-N6)-dimethyltransferase
VLLHWRAVAPRRLGQHFLASAAWRERIARLVLGQRGLTSADALASRRTGELRDLWIEIGAGHGEMTTLLASHVGRLIAIELDTKLLPGLRQKAAGLPNVEVVAGDVLAIDLGELTGKDHFCAYGNLPYYITSPIVHRLLEHADRLDAAFLVIQMEVAARMTARPGRRDYGYFSAFTQFYSRPEILLRIPPGAFQPPPKVSSALIALRMPGQRTQLNIKDEARFLTFLKVCFAQKRKTLRKNLRSLISQTEAVALLQRCQIDPNARAEELALPDLARVFAGMSDVCRTTRSS